MYPKAGDYVWVPVMDDPRNAKRTFTDSGFQFATEAEAKTLCDTWNCYGGDLPWYPMRVRVEPRAARRRHTAGQGRFEDI